MNHKRRSKIQVIKNPSKKFEGKNQIKNCGPKIMLKKVRSKKVLEISKSLGTPTSYTILYILVHFEITYNWMSQKHVCVFEYNTS